MTTNTWTIFNLIGIILSFLLYIIFIVVTETVDFTETYGTAIYVYDSPIFYLVVLLGTVTMFTVDVALIIIRKELITPMIVLFESIVRRGRENEVKLFDDIIKDFVKEEIDKKRSS